MAPYIAPQGGPNGVNHISMYLGYHNIEIKTRDILKLNFGIWNIAGSKPDSVLNTIFHSQDFHVNANLFASLKIGTRFFFKWTWVAIISYLIASDDDMES